jgi:hypothetical protein
MKNNYHPCEQIEIKTCGSRTQIHMRDRLEAISHAYGRVYYYATDASLERIVRLMNSENMELEVRKEGKSLSFIAWRIYPAQILSKEEWRDMDEAPDYEPDQWG